MKNIIVIFAIVLLASCQQEKIGYVDNVKLMDEYQQKIDVESKFKVKADALAKKRFDESPNFSIVADFDAGKKGPPQGNPRPLIQIGNGFVQSS